MLFFFMAVFSIAAVLVLDATDFEGITESDARALRFAALLLYAAVLGMALHGNSFGPAVITATAVICAGYLLTRGALWLIRAWEHPDEQIEHFQRDPAVR